MPSKPNDMPERMQPQPGMYPPQGNAPSGRPMPQGQGRNPAQQGQPVPPRGRPPMQQRSPAPQGQGPMPNNMPSRQGPMYQQSAPQRGGAQPQPRGMPNGNFVGNQQPPQMPPAPHNEPVRQPVSDLPPVQKKYDASMKVGTAAVNYTDVPEKPDYKQENVPPEVAENIPDKDTEDVSSEVKSDSLSSALNIPNLTAKMASVSKAAEEMGFDDNIVEKFNIPEKFLKVKSVIALLCCCLFIGIFLGFILFSPKDNNPRQDQFTIGYIVKNPEVPSNRGRCGAVEQTSGCVLYVQNNKRRELDAKEFYQIVEQLSGLNRFQIETANMRYAHKSIKPGYIAQFNIPPLK